MRSFTKTFLILGLLLCFTDSNAQSYIDYIRNSGSRNLSDIQAYIELKHENDTSYASKKNLKFFNRWKHNIEGRLDKNGDIFNYSAHNYKEMQRFLKSEPQNVTLPNIDRNLHGDWDNVTPTQTNISGPANGRLNCIAIHPTNPNIIYVGSPVGGIWATYNGGSNWINLNPGMDNLGVSDIAINYNNPNEIFILTGDGNSNHSPSMGVFKSTNGGYDWTRTALFWEDEDLIYTYKLLMHPTDPNKMFVVTTEGLYLTQDNWETFERRLEGISLRDLEFEPNFPSRLYASTKKKVYKSNNNGFYWQEITDLSTGLTDSEDWSRVAIAVTPDQPELVYILYAKSHPSSGGWGYHELYRSIDNGNTFTLQSAQEGVVSNQSSYNLALTVEPGNPSTVYLGAVLLYKSSNSGASFTIIAGSQNSSNIHADVHALEWYNNTLYTGTDGGISKSSNGGNTFTNLSDGLTNLQFYDIDLKWNQILGGTQDNGTFLWTTTDNELLHIFGGDGLDCFFHPTENGMYVSTQNERFRKFFGQSWLNITPDGQEDDIWGGPFTKHPHNHDTIYSAVRTFARSFDRGNNWDIFDPGFATDKRMHALAQGINNSEWIYLTNRAEMRRTTNASAATPSWISVISNLPITGSVSITEITIDPENVSRVWVTLSGYADGNKVYYSESGGVGSSAWTNISSNLPNVPVYCIEYLPGSNDGLYIGTDFGVFYKDADMSEWIWFSNGMPKTRVEDFSLTDDYLYAGTFGRGVWRTSHIGNCPYAVVLNEANDPSPAHSTGTQVHTANYILTSNRIITGGFGTNVTYSAGNSIELLPGFHAEYNNEFKAYIGGCPD